MPSQSLKIGPFAAMYVGDYGSNSILTQIYPISTGPMVLTDEVPEQYEPSLDNSIQAGLRKLSFSVSLYGDDNITINLARGLTVGDTNKSDPSPFAQYVLLLVYPDDTVASSVLFTKCYTIKNLNINYSKTEATKVNIQFVAQNRNRYLPIYYMDTVNNLATILGGTTPV